MIWLYSPAGVLPYYEMMRSVGIAKHYAKRTYYGKYEKNSNSIFNCQILVNFPCKFSDERKDDGFMKKYVYWNA